MSGLKRLVSARLRGATPPTTPPPPPPPIPHLLLRRLPTCARAAPPPPLPPPAAAHRHALTTALANARALPVLAPALRLYLAAVLPPRASPAALAWTSALARAPAPFAAGLGLEAAVLLALHGLLLLELALASEPGLGLDPAPDLVLRIRRLHAAAGVFEYLRDSLAPHVLLTFQGAPPPELVPDVANALAHLALAAAQVLHVRRAVLNDTSAPLLCKLSLAARDFAAAAVRSADAADAAGVDLTERVRAVAQDLHLVATGWAFQHLARAMPQADSAGARVAALGEAVDCLQRAAASPLVARVAALELDALGREREDAVGDNKIVYQHAIPKAAALPLPQGRALAHATAFDPRAMQPAP